MSAVVSCFHYSLYKIPLVEMSKAVINCNSLIKHEHNIKYKNKSCSNENVLLLAIENNVKATNIDTLNQ